ncbi:hypothetical protein SB00098_02068 [Klebsiella quasipneumoniae subsp. quasipneumoniae]|nr:hypothetical protein SB00098_02068 [Klebsiella quasipneumoniae subsp. quasipneumoniae]
METHGGPTKERLRLMENIMRLISPSPQGKYFLDGVSIPKPKQVVTPQMSL